MLQPIRLISQSCGQRIIDLKERLWIPVKDNAWIYVAPVPEHLTVLHTGQKSADVEITGSGVLTFLAASTGYENTAIIRSLTVHSVNNTAKGINQPLNFTNDCCEINVDTLPSGAIQLEAPIKSIQTHDENLHLANHKIDNVQKLVEQEQNVTHTSGKNMSFLSLIVTDFFSVFFLLCC
jgi:hypothetical protein